jgi:hypothetical protein
MSPREGYRKRRRSGAHWATWYRYASVIVSPLCATIYQPIRSPGKTTFLNFVLARLIAARQVVLTCSSLQVCLFYQGRVYSRPPQSGFYNLPERLDENYYPMWTLVDVDNRKDGPVLPEASNIWPIQASPPNNIRWAAWRKQFGAAVWGMPLWDMEELIAGYAFGLFSLSAADHVVR